MVQLQKVHVLYIKSKNLNKNCHLCQHMQFSLYFYFTLHISFNLFARYIVLIHVVFMSCVSVCVFVVLLVVLRVGRLVINQRQNRQFSTFINFLTESSTLFDLYVSST